MLQKLCLVQKLHKSISYTKIHENNENYKIVTNYKVLIFSKLNYECQATKQLDQAKWKF